MPYHQFDIPVHEVSEIPARHRASIPKTHIALVVFAKKLHTHHSEYEDNDTEDEGQVGQGSHSVHHDGQNVIERLPRLGKFEDSQQTE